MRNEKKEPVGKNELTYGAIHHMNFLAAIKLKATADLKNYGERCIAIYTLPGFRTKKYKSGPA